MLVFSFGKLLGLKCVFLYIILSNEVVYAQTYNRFKSSKNRNIEIERQIY